MNIFEISQPNETVRLSESGEYEVRLVAPGAEVEILGGWNVRGREQITINLKIVHRAPHTRSNTVLRAVARDYAHATLNGTIIVEPSAPNTNAFLTENILMLSPTAVAQAVPNLEIRTDAVKCSHAATVSPIPESQIFYLQSRGLSREKAEDLIVAGFLESYSS
jgi:Fe-S cluster assembly protein SufD